MFEPRYLHMKLEVKKRKNLGNDLIIQNYGKQQKTQHKLNFNSSLKYGICYRSGVLQWSYFWRKQGLGSADRHALCRLNVFNISIELQIPLFIINLNYAILQRKFCCYIVYVEYKIRVLKAILLDYLY